MSPIDDLSVQPIDQRLDILKKRQRNLMIWFFLTSTLAVIIIASLFLQKEFMAGYIVDYNGRSDSIAQVAFSVYSAFHTLIHSYEYKTNERNIVDALKWFKCGILNNPYFIANGFIPEHLK